MLTGPQVQQLYEHHQTNKQDPFPSGFVTIAHKLGTTPYALYNSQVIANDMEEKFLFASDRALKKVDNPYQGMQWFMSQGLLQRLLRSSQATSGLSLGGKQTLSPWDDVGQLAGGLLAGERVV